MKREIQTRPSSASRWTVCKGSAILEALAYEEEESAPAARGTMLHDQALHYSNEVLGEYDEDAVELVQVANSLIMDFLEEEDTFGEITEIKEERLLVPGYELLAGTGDRLVIAGRRCFLADYKTGRVIVNNDAENVQMTIYAALACLLHPTVESVTTAIIQPRVQNFPLPYTRTREALLSDLSRFNEIAKELHAWDGATELPFVAGDHCKYCKAKANCEEYMESLGLKDLVVLKTENKPMTVLSDEDLVAIYKAKGLIKKIADYMDSVKDELSSRLSERAIEGVAWGVGRGSRVWTDEFSAANALQVLGVDPWNTSIISPHAAELRLREKKVKKTEIADYITSIAGRPSLKLIGDGEE